MDKIGIVVIGRNEARILENCLKAVIRENVPVIYADSASEDNSVAIAHNCGVPVVKLDKQTPLSPARGRNEGYQYLLQHHPDIEFIQFIDGDCVLIQGWLDIALQTMNNMPEVGILCGEVSEENPNGSIYKRLAALEWNQPAGEIKVCGGIFMTRKKALQDVNGFNTTIRAGEDDDICLRSHEQGWKIWRIKNPMAQHHIRIENFWDLWTRAKRSGYAFQGAAFLHRGLKEWHYVRDNLSNYLFGGLIPLIAIVGIPWTHGLSLFLLFAYPALWLRIYLRHRENLGNDDARLYASFCVFAKFPGFLGAIEFWFSRLFKSG